MQNRSSHPILIFGVLLILINLVMIDIKLFSQTSTRVSDISTYKSPVIESANSIKDTRQNCPVDCLNIIREATAEMELRIGTTNRDDLWQIAPQTAPQNREFYVPLGNGTTSKTDWDDLTATETILDPANYGSIKEAYFIASLSNVTQNGTVQAQLYNVTDKHPVWGSEVSMTGKEAQTITSGRIQIENGNKLYRVRIKSSLGYQVSLENGKIRIVTE
jgi:hypothetical protein